MPIVTSLDQIMQRATMALTRMDYLSCEEDCLEALREARAAGDWAYYCRVLMPLQEARRQRRMIAAEGTIRLGTGQLAGPATAWLDSIESGCIVVTHPFKIADAQQLEQTARDARRHIEVLYADNPVSADPWTLRSFAGPNVLHSIAPPPTDWIDRWMPASQDPSTPPPWPADWFVGATEALGDAALRQVDTPLGDSERLAALEQRLAVITDHEFLHQRLWDAASALGNRTGI